MSIKEQIKHIFSLLNEELRCDLYYQNIETIIMDMINDIRDIRVSPLLFDDCLDLDIDVDVALDDKLIEIVFLDGLFSVSRVNDQYFIDLRLENEQKRFCHSMFKSGTFVRLEEINILKEQGFYKDFDCQVSYYSNYINLDLHVKGEDDYVFAQEFGMPPVLGRYFRLNFKKLAPVIQQDWLQNGKINSYEEYLNKEDFYQFLRPFYLSEFDDFINDELKSEVDGCLKKVLTEFNVDEPVYKNDLSYIFDQLLAMVGDGRVVISSNIYQSIILYLMGYSSNFYTNGIMIKTENDLYTLYYVSLSNNQLMVIPKPISQEEAQEMFISNDSNLEISELEDFFGMGLDR